MRIGFLSDIHGNREALDACLAHGARTGIDRWVFLGDLVGYGADPQYVVDCVVRHMETGALALLGNHDQAVVDGLAEGMNEYARAAIEWTARQLDPAAAALIRSLPMSILEDDRLYVHSEAHSPKSWNYVTEILGAERSMNATEARVTLCGHVHRPQLYYMSRTKPPGYFLPQAGTGIPLIGRRKWLAVLGSVGQPRDRNPAAAYAILDTDRNEIAYQRTPYNVEKAAAKIHAAGLPQMLAARLFIGR